MKILLHQMLVSDMSENKLLSESDLALAIFHDFFAVTSCLGIEFKLSQSSDGHAG